MNILLIQHKTLRITAFNLLQSFSFHVSTPSPQRKTKLSLQTHPVLVLSLFAHLISSAEPVISFPQVTFNLSIVNQFCCELKTGLKKLKLYIFKKSSEPSQCICYITTL